MFPPQTRKTQSKLVKHILSYRTTTERLCTSLKRVCIRLSCIAKRHSRKSFRTWYTKLYYPLLERPIDKRREKRTTSSTSPRLKRTLSTIALKSEEYRLSTYNSGRPVGDKMYYAHIVSCVNYVHLEAKIKEVLGAHREVEDAEVYNLHYNDVIFRRLSLYSLQRGNRSTRRKNWINSFQTFST